MYETLTDIFDAVAVKYLSGVDIPKVNSKGRGSNQHELGGLKKAGIGQYLGEPGKEETFKFNVTMAYINDEEEEPTTCRDVVSWYDSRRKSPHRSPEYRLYYKDNEVVTKLKESDFMLVAITKDKELVMVFAPEHSEAEHQLKTVFSIDTETTDSKFSGINLTESDILLPVRTMLGQLGIDLYGTNDEQKLDLILEKFGESFPKTKEFSLFTRSISEQVDPCNEPDQSLLLWMNEEEKLFRILERHIVSVRLQQGFGENGDDVDEFISFSLSVQNRRKSRVGHAFENHIEEVLQQNSVLFERGKKTEGKQSPDFLFPSQEKYHTPDFDPSLLRMLGAKTTCKERWRQVLAEAKRIDLKHLITLEPAISEDQTQQMKDMNLQLVVPDSIQQTYTEQQRMGLQSFKEFIEEVKQTQ
jgi:hypothetical protein